MNDAFLARRIRRVQNPTRVFNGLFERERTFQPRTLDALHHQIVRTDIVPRADVRMVQRGDSARLAPEAVAESFLRNLDGNDAVKTRVTRLVDLSHAARADQRENLVGTEPLSRGERHTVVQYSSRELKRIGNVKRACVLDPPST